MPLKIEFGGGRWEEIRSRVADGPAVTLSLSFDHRVMDGAEAGRALKALGAFLAGGLGWSVLTYGFGRPLINWSYEKLLVWRGEVAAREVSVARLGRAAISAPAPRAARGSRGCSCGGSSSPAVSTCC